MARVTERDRERFAKDGYLIIEDVLSDADLEAVHREYEAVLAREATRLWAEGRVSETYEGLAFAERYTALMRELDDLYDLYQHLDISLPLLHEMSPDATLHAGPAVFERILRNPAILDVAEAFLGGEICSSPVQHTRIKPPVGTLEGMVTDSNVSKTFWHQDEAVLAETADEIDMLTVWVAMTPAQVENGCMVAVPGSHRADPALAMHCPGSTVSSAEIFIPDDLIGQDVVPLAVERGGLVLLHQRTVHGSLENTSDRLRWSFDLRYFRTGQASGREVFPSFVARSRTAPEAELRDADAYREAWFDARDRLAAQGEIAFNTRWSRYGDHPLCA